MKMSKTSIFTLFILIFIFKAFPVLTITNTINLPTSHVDVLQVNQSGPTLSILLDYNLSSTSYLDTNELLNVLVVFSDSSQEDPLTIKAAMLFFHTSEDQFFLFWMLGDPYKQVQNWHTGTKNEHYQTNGNLLTLNFIEFQGISNQETECKILARISADFEVNSQVNDFREILDFFIADLPLSYEFSHLPTPSDTKKKGINGFTILTATIGVLLSVLLVKKNRENF
ncbi:MAG: hypothetical protein ACFE95_09565 [Candidatus Hodarchaeota archaeon]